MSEKFNPGDRVQLSPLGWQKDISPKYPVGVVVNNKYGLLILRDGLKTPAIFSPYFWEKQREGQGGGL